MSHYTLEEQVRRAAAFSRRTLWIAPMTGFALAAAFVLGRCSARLF